MSYNLFHRHARCRLAKSRASLGKIGDSELRHDHAHGPRRGERQVALLDDLWLILGHMPHPQGRANPALSLRYGKSDTWAISRGTFGAAHDIQSENPARDRLIA